MRRAVARKRPQPEPRFRLRVERDELGRPLIVVLQRELCRHRSTTELTFRPIVRARGLALEVAMPLLAALLRECDINPSRLTRPTREDDPPIDLDEANGVRAALALFAVRPLRRIDRMESVIRGIQAMSAEEALYWFARVMRGPRSRTLRALRILLASE